ncbi:Secreted Ly-6/uPAR-related protein 1 [Camelus dromedarius]|uniref:Secreted Ly-6/uPAR-related protein 1 n=3 Tax=Camelus TaxID=9836 RepID=A0A5N4CH13_CAMDR|nr:secreted Ly-6/uPAR-related protein 1 [Camelus dromedarius]XP_032323610.1 secreted Ly-6/uPAR-related protein 1 [Camelus ferus]XP_045359739.1 secreted Ly-6/uPAR-related protein 1 [Camelus bactrianus]EPY84003.1 secreted Ly-6/uPAR-related protein 1 [Camelus ferus]KAB1258208.1 Secreted Ly-6/uPAR-related protein 1 [Camelus dromedarius]
MASPRALPPLLLLAALLGAHSGEAFRCFTCKQPTPISLCKNITRCKPEHTACKTTLVAVESEFPFGQSPVVTRSCSSSCTATDPDSFGVRHPVFCCFRDLCNSVGAARLSAGALATLGATLLSHLLP